MTRPIARKGDKEAVHCSRPYRKGHFFTVFANRIQISGHGHANTTHLLPCACPPCCCPHSATLRATQRRVFAEGKPVGRVGDPTCTVVVQGSPNVFVGGGGGPSSFTGSTSISQQQEIQGVGAGAAMEA